MNELTSEWVNEWVSERTGAPRLALVEETPRPKFPSELEDGKLAGTCPHSVNRASVWAPGTSPVWPYFLGVWLMENGLSERTWCFSSLGPPSSEPLLEWTPRRWHFKHTEISWWWLEGSVSRPSCTSWSRFDAHTSSLKESGVPGGPQTPRLCSAAWLPLAERLSFLSVYL